jgi:hypothetical protein
MGEPLATNHERIWLQPLCCVDERCWCDQPQDCGDAGCELPAIEYVRADIAAAEIEKLRAENQALKHGGDAENERLREALKTLDHEARWMAGQLNGYGQTTLKKTREVLAQSAAALNSQNDGGGA